LETDVFLAEKVGGRINKKLIFCVQNKNVFLTRTMLLSLQELKLIWDLTKPNKNKNCSY
jgi:hypothetical protein